ncbi:MAG: SIS domain-containing protein [Armatimonadetes bacterium]|nr:SIS domain-containing protein [Armatimonadota bacterium]
MHDMLREILEQPQVVARLVENGRSLAREVARLAESHDVQQVVFAARGTSDHAAVYGQYLFQVECGIAAFLAAPSVVTVYRKPLHLPKTMVIGISQSGCAQDVMEYMSAAREQGSPVVAITNDPASELSRLADISIPLGAGVEKSVAATKTYTATLAALALIAAYMGNRTEALDDLAEAPDLMDRTIKMSAGLQRIAATSPIRSECFVVGRGLNYATALETALKIMETSYVLARGYSAADFLHGPVAAAQAVPGIIYVPHDEARDSVLEVARSLYSKGTHLTVVSSDREALGLSADAVEVPKGRSRWVDPLAQILVGQRLAYQISVARGLDPDTPRGLSKVTVTV